MIELFEIYLFAFILCPIASAVLSIFGAHLVSRNESLQLMALSQAALVGNIIGHLLSDQIEMISLLMSLVLFISVKLIFSKFKIHKEQSYIVSYIAFIALAYLAVTLFPSLDSHFAVGFFGDIVSISSKNAIIYSGIYLTLLISSFYFHHNLVKSTFNKSVLRIQKTNYYEETFFILGILLSLYGLGFLFTMAFLIFPVMITGQIYKSLRQGLIVMALIAAFSSISGLALSITFSRIATVPAQVIILLIILLLTRIVFIKVRNIS